MRIELNGEIPNPHLDPTRRTTRSHIKRAHSEHIGLPTNNGHIIPPLSRLTRTKTDPTRFPHPGGILRTNTGKRLNRLRAELKNKVISGQTKTHPTYIPKHTDQGAMMINPFANTKPSHYHQNPPHCNSPPQYRQTCNTFTLHNCQNQDKLTPLKPHSDR